MNKLYYEDAYLEEFYADIIECIEQNGSFLVILSETAFYPEGGGQPSDIGTIGDCKVIEVMEKNGIIYHILDSKPKTDKKILCKIDIKRRFRFMQNHSGEHIISGLINKHFGYANVGFHMGTDCVTIDFDGEMTQGQLGFIEGESNGAIYKNIPIHAYYPDENELNDLSYRSKKKLTGEVRIVDIPGCDTCACCGTHVSSSGEIGIIKILSSQKYKSGVRLYIACGYDAVEDYNKRLTEIYAVSHMLSAKADKIGLSVANLLEDNTAKKNEIYHLKEMIFKIKTDSLPDNMNISIIHFDNLLPEDLKRFSQILSEKSDVSIVFTGKEEYKYAIASKTQDVRSFIKKMNDKYNGKGGGSQNLGQGTISGDFDEIECFVLSLANNANPI